ncbi:CotH kinase family protein [uncultured Fibrobacter sp.]|uniref:CotH kinase family protein n=1 Tax=uncultured Fibrobacter sp. TaxID=261512 RepID=UPI002603B4E5|nr:CotH kinase family protein [uncultured Fibrobacter sp.]
MNRFARQIKHVLSLAAFLGCLILAGCYWEETDSEPDYLPIDDSMYPYAGLPRIVIETENFSGVRDRETEIPSRLQIYGERSPESEVLKLTVRGRGNSSFKMPKYGLKLEFEDKVSLMGMPKNRDWALVANYGDKTHLRNYMMTRLSEWLGATYTPKMQFVELYLNRNYMGLYLLSETVKVSKSRVNIEENDSTFLVEKEDSKKYDPPYVKTDSDYYYHIKSPKNPSEETQKLLLDHLNAFEKFLAHRYLHRKEEIKDWIDLDDYLLYYWVQEYSKNEDGNYARSVYFTWKRGETIHFGPLWDFDLAFGNASRSENKNPEDWYIRKYRLNYYIMNNSLVDSAAADYWTKHRNQFKDLIDSVPLYRSIIEKAVENEYRRWPIIGNTENWALKDPYDSYDEAVETMVEWMQNRFEWIDSRIRN